MPKDYFAEGKNGLNGAKQQYDDALSMFLVYIEMFDPKLKDSTENYFKANPGAGITDKKKAAKVEKRMAELKTKLDKMLETSEGKVAHFDGYLSFIDKMMDTKRGDYSRAVSENGYLSKMIHMVHNGPKNLDEETIQNLGPALHPLNKFFSGLSYLLECEYEKQRVMENYSPEKERDYLMDLSGILFQMIQNHEEFDKLVNEDGKSPYDSYLMQPLDVMTGKDINGVSGDRSCKRSIENIKGQYAAIQNGFGINDLEMCGQISEMAYLAEYKRRSLEKQLDPEKLEKRLSGINKRVASTKKAFDDTKKEVDEAKAALDALRNSNASKAQIDEQTRKVESLEGNLLLREREYNEVLKALADENNRRTKLSESLKKFTKLSGELQALDKKTKNTKITKATDKHAISDAFYKVLNEAKADPDLDDSFQKDVNNALKITKNSMKYAGIIPEKESLSPEMKKHFFRVEDYGDYNALSSVKSNFMQPMGMQDAPAGHGVDVFIDMTEKRPEEVKDILEEIMLYDSEEYYTGVMHEGMWYKMKYTLPADQEERELLVNQLRKELRIQKNAYTQFIESDKGYRNDFRREYKATSLTADESKGYIIQAMAEQPYVTCYFTHLYAEVPSLYMKDLDPNKVGKDLLENGITENLNAYMDAGKDIILAEYEKAKMRETGWDAGKERLYLAKFYDGAKRSIESFNRLSALDYEVQEESWRMGNEIAHLTAVSTSQTVRDAKSVITGLEWAVKGIENGWSSKNLTAFQIGGMMEGYVERMRIKLDAAIVEFVKKRNDNPTTKQEIAKEKKRAEKEAELRNRLNEIRQWQENTFKPFKEKLLNRRINSPIDELKSIVEIKEFLKEQSKNPELEAPHVGNYTFQGNMVENLYQEVKDTLIPLSIDNCVRDIREAEKVGIDLFEQKREPVSFTICDKSREMKTYLDALRSGEELDAVQRELMTKEFLRNKFLDGMNQDANPEYFDYHHRDYAAIQRKLNDFTAQYANRLMTLFEDADNKELADVLENGNWNNLFAEMKDRLSAEASRARLDGFVQGRPERNKNDISLDKAITNLENSPARFGSSSSLYNGIVSDLKELEKMRLSLGTELMQKFHVDFKIVKTVVKEDGRDVTKLDYVLPDDVKVDDRKFKKYLDLQLDVMNRMEQYIQGKNDIITKEGGDPDILRNASLLGENGERRYRSMLDAKKALTNSINATKEFGNNGPSDTEKIMLQKPNYLLHPLEYINEKAPNAEEFKDDPEGYENEMREYNERQEENRKDFIDEEKDRILRDAKFNAWEDFRDIIHEFDKMLAEEAEIRRGIVNQLNKIKAVEDLLEKARTNPAFKKEFEDSGKAAILEANRAKYEEMKKSVPALEEQLTTSAERSFMLEATKAKFVNHHEKVQKDLIDKQYKPFMEPHEKIIAEVKPYVDAEREYLEAKEKLKAADSLLQDKIEEYENTGRKYEPKYKEDVKAAKLLMIEKKGIYEEKCKNVDMKSTKEIYEKETTALNELQKKKAVDYKVIECGGNSLIATEQISLQDYIKQNDELRKVYTQLKGKSVKHLENFDKQVIQNNPFRDNYRKIVLENAKKGYYDAESITNARDTILKKAAEVNCNNKEALESVRQISNAMGSKLNINEIAEKAKSLQAGAQAGAEAGKNVEAPKKGGPKL